MEKVIILISGKRKSGKDYFSEQLIKRLKNVEIVRISEPIKSEWTKRLNLDLAQLLSDSAYKEKYRKDMIDWSDEVRKRDYGFFCREAMKNRNADIIIVSDIRRKTDIRYFKESYGDSVKTLRIECPVELREKRGWSFSEGVDDVASECDLDDYSDWDLIIQNDDDFILESAIELVNEKFLTH